MWQRKVSCFAFVGWCCGSRDLWASLLIRGGFGYYLSKCGWKVNNRFLPAQRWSCLPNWFLPESMCVHVLVHQSDRSHQMMMSNDVMSVSTYLNTLHPLLCSNTWAHQEKAARSDENHGMCNFWKTNTSLWTIQILRFSGSLPSWMYTPFCFPKSLTSKTWLLMIQKRSSPDQHMPLSRTGLDKKSQVLMIGLNGSNHSLRYSSQKWYHTSYSCRNALASLFMLFGDHIKVTEPIPTACIQFFDSCK